MSVYKEKGMIGTMGDYKVVGHPLIRKDAIEKVTGEAVFGEDFKFPGELYGAVYRSPHAHAVIKNINIDRVKDAEGVKVVLTGDDIENVFGQYIVDQPVLAKGKVRYAGEPVVAVAADTQAHALAAIKLVEAEYELLTPVLTAVDAFAEDAPLVHDKWSCYKRAADATCVDGTNICDHFKLRHGDWNKGFEKADYVIENTYNTASVNHSTIERHCATAQFNPVTKTLTIWGPIQSPFTVKKLIASLFGLPHNDVRIISTYIGGGFGGKFEAKVEPIVAALAMHSGGRHVRMTWGRHEDYMGGCIRGASTTRIKTGFNKDGKLVAQKIETWFDTGAYSTTGPRINYNAGFAAITPYKIPNVCIDCYCMVTNKQLTSAYRGFGKPEISFAYENQMDIIADKLGMDPLELRLKNIYHTGDISATGEKLPCVGTEECLKEAAKLIGWDKGYKPRIMPNGKIRSKAICCGTKLTGTPSSSSVVLKFNDDATVDVLQSGGELGQGAWTVIPMIVAERLGVPYENVRCTPLDTAFTPYEKTTTGSRLTFHEGNAAYRAADDCISQLMRLASIMWGCRESDVSFKDGVMYSKKGDSLAVKDVPKTTMLKEREPIVGRGHYATSDVWDKPDIETHQSKKPTVQWFWVAEAAKVEVDPKTGKVDIIDFAAAQDVGRAINTMNCLQQVEGAVAMGTGHAMTEELIYDKEGHLLNGNMVDFKVPTVKDVPKKVGVALVENPVPDMPYGARGIGEPPVVPVAATLGCAISRACGSRITSIPIKPEKVLDALADGKEEK